MSYEHILSNFLSYFAVPALFVCCFLISVNAQRIAILTPEKNKESENFAKQIENSFSGKFKILDKSLGEVAFSSVIYEKPFNLSLKEAKNVGAAIGSDYFLLIQAKTLRRFSLEKKEFYESYAAIYIVSSRSGRLVFWKLVNCEAKIADEAETLLLNSAKSLTSEISQKISETEKEEINEKPLPELEELPEENSQEAKNFQPPLPYKRFRPDYTETANLYSIEATVDILLDVDENGKILRSEISRWAGFGLDESVTKTVMEMNWRPASRNGKTLPIRVLLRYNFKKIDKE
jgi:hypothetical protein